MYNWLLGISFQVTSLTFWIKGTFQQVKQEWEEIKEDKKKKKKMISITKKEYTKLLSACWGVAPKHFQFSF